MSFKKKIKLDEYDLRIVIKALNEFRNRLIQLEYNTEPVDDLFVRFVETLNK